MLGDNIISKGFAPRPDENRFPMSRDFVMPFVPCGAKDCIANNGTGKCVMPSCIKINQKRKCKGYHKSTNEGKGGS